MPRREFAYNQPTKAPDFKLTITRDAVSLGSVGLEKQTKPAHLLGALYPGIPIGLLPVALRWISPDWRHVILERPPRQTVVEFRADVYGRGERATYYSLWIPWTITMMSFGAGFHDVQQLRVHPTKGPLTSLEDPMYMLALPNVVGMGHICCTRTFGAEYAKIRKRKGVTWSELVGWVANHPWTSGFNHSAGNWATYKPKAFEHNAELRYWSDWLKHWQKSSLNDVLAWEWPMAYKEVQLCIGETLRNAGYSQNELTLYQAAIVASQQGEKLCQ